MDLIFQIIFFHICVFLLLQNLSFQSSTWLGPFSEFYFSAAGGEIFNLCLPELAEMVSENDIIRLIKQILEGVHYLHQNNIVHLDLKVT